MDIDIKKISFLAPGLIEKVKENCSGIEVAKGTQILSDEQYIKALPIVISGLIKVFSRFEDKELLLYYIKAEESCVMTFSAAMNGKPSKVFAVTEEDSVILLIPIVFLPKWLKEYPDFSDLFFNQYNLRYVELLDTIRYLLVDRMDKRLYDYIRKKCLLTNNTHIKLSHGQIANELGTSREVITRILKKLEIDGKLIQDKKGIQIIGEW